MLRVLFIIKHLYEYNIKILLKRDPDIFTVYLYTRNNDNRKIQGPPAPHPHKVHDGRLSDKE